MIHYTIIVFVINVSVIFKWEVVKKLIVLHSFLKRRKNTESISNRNKIIIVMQEAPSRHIYYFSVLSD